MVADGGGALFPVLFLTSERIPGYSFAALDPHISVLSRSSAQDLLSSHMCGWVISFISTVVHSIKPMLIIYLKSLPQTSVEVLWGICLCSLFPPGFLIFRPLYFSCS